MTLFEQARQCMKRQQWGAAVPLWQAMLQQAPEDIDAVLALAECLRQLGLLDEAVVMARNALAQAQAKVPASQVAGVPTGAGGREGALWAQAALQLAHLYALQQRQDEAGAAFSQWLAHPVWGAQAAVGLARVWLHEGYPMRAMQALSPFALTHAEATQAMALALFEAGDASRALEAAWPTAVDVTDLHALSNALMFASYVPGYETHLQALRELAQPVMAHIGGGPAVQGLAHGRMTPQQTAARPLRVGWVSADFYAHPIGYFLASFLPHLSDEGVQSFCYDNGQKHDAWTDRLVQASTRWVPIAKLNAQDVCDEVARDGLDILIDLSGHTQGNRLDVFARRACSVQASFLGYFSTTLVPAMDYLITDALHVLPHEQLLCSEQVAYLPHSRFCYAPPEFSPEPVPPPVIRNGYVTWGAFTNLAKISDGCVALWARVLLATPDSRLQLRWKTLVDSGVRQTLRERFASHGVSPGRIEMYGATRHLDMLAAYGEVDVALDTWPFSGATPTCEALWMGVPVVTLVSDRPAGRQSASILQTLDASDWIAHSEEDFVQRAVACADDHDALVLARQGLRKKMASTSLGDGRLFAHGFAQTLRRLV